MIFPPSCYGTVKLIEKSILEQHLYVKSHILYFLSATVQDTIDNMITRQHKLCAYQLCVAQIVNILYTK